MQSSREGRLNLIDGVQRHIDPNIARAISSPTAWRIAIVMVFVLQMMLTLTHRPWFDEWQSLQIAVQSPTIADILDNLRYEGHPPLWYLLLRLTAFVVPTYWVLPTVALAIALPTQWLILQRSPFPRWQRLALALGVFVMFEYMTISRSLTLGVACMFFASALRRSRWTWVFIALLPQCDFLFGVISIAFIALLARDRAWFTPGLLGWALSSGFAAYTVIPAPDMVGAIALGPAYETTMVFIQRLAPILVPWQSHGNLPGWNGYLPFGLGFAGGLAACLFLWQQVRGNIWHMAIIFGFVLITFIFSIKVYPLSVRHLGLSAMLLVSVRWYERDVAGARSAMFGAWLVVGAICGLAVATINLTRPFDTSAEAAAEIRARGLLDKRWIVMFENRGQGISALSGMEFEGEGAYCTQSFVRWNRRSSVESLADVRRYLEAMARQGRFYLLTDFRVDDLPRGLVTPITTIKPGYNGYAYVLSVVAPGAADSPRRPRCAPARRDLVQPTIWER